MQGSDAAVWNSGLILGDEELAFQDAVVVRIDASQDQSPTVGLCLGPGGLPECGAQAGIMDQRSNAISEGIHVSRRHQVSGLFVQHEG